MDDISMMLVFLSWLFMLALIKTVGREEEVAKIKNTLRRTVPVLFFFVPKIDIHSVAKKIKQQVIDFILKNHGNWLIAYLFYRNRTQKKRARKDRNKTISRIYNYHHVIYEGGSFSVILLLFFTAEYVFGDMNSSFVFGFLAICLIIKCFLRFVRVKLGLLGNNENEARDVLAFLLKENKKEGGPSGPSNLFTDEELLEFSKSFSPNLSPQGGQNG